MSTVNCASISPPVETYYQNKRCYTYLSEITVFRSSIMQQLSIEDYQDTFVTLTIQSNQLWQPPLSTVPLSDVSSPQLYIHQSDQIPVDLLTNPLLLSLNQHYQIQFSFLKFVKLDHNYFKCHNYSEQTESSSSTRFKQLISRQDCLDRCIMEQMEKWCDECTTNQLPIRRDLISQSQKQVCLNMECDHNTMDTILDHCGQQCPSHCLSMMVDREVTEELLDDPSETLVTLTRKITVDKVIEQLPAMDLRKLTSEIGGLIAFWIIFTWFTYQLIQFGEYCLDTIIDYFL